MSNITVLSVFRATMAPVTYAALLTFGKYQLVGVENVFYVQLQLSQKEISKVKVPIHINIIDFARRKQTEIHQALSEQRSKKSVAITQKEAKDVDEIVKSLEKKLEVLKQFLDVANFTEKMVVSKKLSGQKNEDDPLTNLGITKPGARLKNKFGTINQEYHLTESVQLPSGSGLWLKDATGNDKQVGRLIEVEGKTKWSLEDKDTKLINDALKSNIDFRG